VTQDLMSDSQTSDTFPANGGRLAIRVLNQGTIDASKPDNEPVYSIGLIISSKHLRLELDLDYPTVSALITRLCEEIGEADSSSYPCQRCGAETENVAKLPDVHTKCPECGWEPVTVYSNSGEECE
jgi:DNA-directed RNA polymerase subunit RPC12/RpoP